jgi:hypothetical protein
MKDPKAKRPPVTRDEHGTGWNYEDRNAFFDRHGCRSWILTTRDADGNQVGEADYCHAREDAMRWLKTGSLSKGAEKGTKKD